MDSEKLKAEAVFKSIVFGVLLFIIFYLCTKLWILDEAINLPLDQLLQAKLK